MRYLAIILAVLFMFSGSAVAGQKIACLPAPENTDSDPDNDVVTIFIVKDGVETTAPYTLIPEINMVKLVELADDDEGVYQFAWANAQGRKSKFVSFDLKAPPNGCAGLKIID